MPGGVARPVMHDGPYLEGRALWYPIGLITSLFFLWGFSYGLLDVLNAHFQSVLGLTKLESTGLQIAYFGGGYVFFSPIAGEVMRRFGYKRAVNMGLTFYSLGAVMFWPTAHYTTPSNHKAAFGGFVACTFVIACGLATLEVAANSYATVIGNPRTASRRLQFCQSWNGVASFIGPLIASKAFFSAENSDDLTNVQFVYLAVACAGLAVNILFFFSKMPEISEEVLEAMRKAEQGQETSETDGPFYKQYNCIAGFVAQFCYVGAQVTVATFFINYVNENGGLQKDRASFLLSMALLTFTIARFVSVALCSFLAANFVLCVFSACTIVLGVLCSTVKGNAAVGCIMVVFFFMSCQYPIIFVMATDKLGRHTRRGSALVVMGVGGGAAFPPIQGAIAGAASTRISYFVPTAGFVVVFCYATWRFLITGRNIRIPVEVVKVEADEEVAKDTTMHTSMIGGITSQPISLVKTRESVYHDNSLAKVRSRIDREPLGSTIVKMRTNDPVHEMPSLSHSGAQRHDELDDKY